MATRSALIDFYITQRNYINKGMSETLWLQKIIQIIMIIGIFMGIFYEDSVNFPLLVAFVLIGGFSWWLVGFIWDKIKGYHMEAEWGNRRNPTITEIKQNTKKRKI